MRTLAVTLIAGAILAGTAARGMAQCALTADANLARKSVKKSAACNDKRLRSGPGATCTLAAPPACAGTLATDAVALAYGPNNPPPAAAKELRDHRRCQKQIGKGVADFVKKLVYVIKGRSAADAELRARRSLDKVADRCALVVAADPASGLVLPAVGAQCAAAIGPVGGVVNAVALRDCLLTLMRTWVDRVVPNPQPLRPNILFILTDDQRWDTTDGTHGLGGADVMPRTRAELVDSGIEFTNGFMTTPLCCPSRSSILTGSYAHRTGVYKNGGNNGGADDFADAQSIAVWLHDAGYRTSLIGKYLNGYQALWNINTEPPYVPPGWSTWQGLRKVSYFDEIFVEPDGMGGYTTVQYGSSDADYVTDVMREKAKDFISEAVAASQPFFLYLSFKAPHLPQIPAPRHDGLFQGIPPWRPPSYNEADVSDKPQWVQNLAPQDSADLDQIRIDQLEMLQAVDEAIGGNPAYGIVGIMEHLRALGIADDTIVVFFSDNGWFWGEHRLRAKNNPYEEAIRSPMFVRYPKLAPLPRTDDRFALNIDLAPTFAELAGVGVPIAHDGVSLVRVLDGTAPSWRTDFLAEAWPASHPWALVREARWKYTELPVTPGDPATAFETELYDLLNDPYELTNVASDPANAPRVAAMAARLRQLRPNWPIDSDPNGPDPEEDE
jgi:N-acetylglucosamine-6-sulfatase